MRVHFNPSLYFIADPSLCRGRAVKDVVAAALRGGVTMVQYRDKSQDKNEILQQAKILKNLCESYHIPFLLNDHADIALETSADGVHLGQGDMSPVEARALLGPDKIIGLTAFTEKHIGQVALLNDAPSPNLSPPGRGTAPRRPLPAGERAGVRGERLVREQRNIVDYIGTGPVYPTKTDKGKPVLGVEAFAALIKSSPVPAVGIGGITPENAAAVIKAGAAGVAMMRAMSEADDPEAAARAFKKVISG